MPPTRQSQPTISELLLNDLAPHERTRLFQGLEDFVNVGDSRPDYRALASQWPTFWPHDIDDGGTPNALNWAPDAHALFQDYRDKLRKVWAADPEAQLSPLLSYLLGIIQHDELVSGEYTLDVDATWFGRELDATHRAWRSLLQSHPDAKMAPHSMAFPLWGVGNLRYLPRTEFEQALWRLCQENWRARICGQCKRYFVADKAAQRYCNTQCYGEAKRSQKLTWWNETGKRKRAQRRLVLRRQDRAEVGRKKSRTRGAR